MKQLGNMILNEKFFSEKTMDSLEKSFEKHDEVEKMDNFTAVMIAEGVEEPKDEEQYLAAWQHLVDTGLAYTLQGYFGRNADRMIENGQIRAA